MNIWQWVYDMAEDLREEGQPRLAMLVNSLSSAVVDGRVDDVEAMVPEALALARSLNRPWLEVYIRHWHLQSRLGDCGEGQTALHDAVDALEFAHRDEARGCPQAVCTVQDLSFCYANTDGPGWAAERLAVVDETLERINPAWPCWSCLTGEKAEALLDLGKTDEALAVTRQVRVDTGLSGEHEYTLIISRLDVLVAAGLFDEAVSEADGFLGRQEPEHKQTSVRVRRALALARAGRMDEAVAGLPTSSDVRRSDYIEWADTVAHAVAAGAMPNDSSLGAVLRWMFEDLRKAGSWHRAAELADRHGRLAVARGRRWPAEQAARDMAEVVARLRRPEPMRERLAHLEAAVSSMAGGGAGGAGADGGGSGGENADDPEAALDELDRAYREAPDDDEAAAAFALALLRSGHERVAEALLADHARRRPVASDATHLLTEVVLRNGDEGAVAELASLLEPQAAVLAWWLQARHAHARRQWDECMAACARIVQAEDGAVNTRRLWAEAARETKQFETALRLSNEAIERSPEPNPSDDWDRMVAATAVGDWAAVRESAARLGIELAPGDGPVDEEWHGVGIRYDSGDEVFAVRTGPVTARVLTVALPNQEQRHGDVVVFDARLLEPAPEDEEEQASWVPLHRHVTDLSKGGFAAYEVDGLSPGDEAVGRVRDALRDIGGTLWIWSTEGYELATPDDPDTPVPGLYAMVAVPPGREGQAHEMLSAAFAGVRLAWPDLAEAAADPETAAAHRALLDSLT